MIQDRKNKSGCPNLTLLLWLNCQSRCSTSANVRRDTGGFWEEVQLKKTLRFSSSGSQSSDGFSSSPQIHLMTIPLFLSVVSTRFFFPSHHPPSIPPFFLSPFIDERLPQFSVNGPQSSELNIDFIRSLVTWSVTTRCLLQKKERRNGGKKIKNKISTRTCLTAEERWRERRGEGQMR